MLTSSRVISTALPIAQDPFGRSFAITGRLQARIGNGDESDIKAALVSISPGAVAAARHSKQASSPVAGVLYGALKELADLADSMAKVQQEIQGAAAGSERQAALSQELQSLSELYTQSVQSKTFTDARSVLQQLEQNTSGGQAGLSDASVRALLGDQVLSAARVGSLDRLQSLGSALGRLSEVDLSQPQASDTIKALVDRALKAFDGPIVEEGDPGAVLPEGKLMVTDAPEALQMTFVGANATAISLRTLDAKNMIKAAAAHFDFDSQNVLMLIADPKEEQTSKEEEEQRKTEEKRNNHVNPRQVALFYGSQAPESVALDPSTGEVVWSSGTQTSGSGN